jgi:ribosome biogenesis GTPase
VSPPRRRRELDESDVRIRPNPRGSRPRTKERPRHEDSTSGWVIGVGRGRYTVLLGGPENPGTAVTAMKARELGRAGVIVGDRVALVGDASGDRGTLARIVRVEERSTLLRRSADDSTESGDPVERPIVANADQLAVVTALADPEPRPRLVDRALVAAYDAGLDPLLVLTKADLRDPEPFLASYAVLDVPSVVTRMMPGGPDGERRIGGLDALRDRLADRVTVLLGHSGVGKSTLVNALVPDAARATAEVNEVTGRGRHTSASAVALALPGGGWVIDTPGVRSFGLAHVDPDRIIAAFPDLLPGTVDCPRGCSHDEPDCALGPFVAVGGAGASGPARLESLRRLLRSRAGADDSP